MDANEQLRMARQLIWQKLEIAGLKVAPPEPLVRILMKHAFWGDVAFGLRRVAGQAWLEAAWCPSTGPFEAWEMCVDDNPPDNWTLPPLSDSWGEVTELQKLSEDEWWGYWFWACALREPPPDRFGPRGVDGYSVEVEVWDGPEVRELSAHQPNHRRHPGWEPLFRDLCRRTRERTTSPILVDRLATIERSFPIPTPGDDRQPGNRRTRRAMRFGQSPSDGVADPDG